MTTKTSVTAEIEKWLRVRKKKSRIRIRSYLCWGLGWGQRWTEFEIVQSESSPVSPEPGVAQGGRSPPAKLKLLDIVFKKICPLLKISSPPRCPKLVTDLVLIRKNWIRSSSDLATHCKRERATLLPGQNNWSQKFWKQNFWQKMGKMKIWNCFCKAVGFNLELAKPQGFMGRFPWALGWQLSFNVLLFINPVVEWRGVAIENPERHMHKGQ